MRVIQPISRAFAAATASAPLDVVTSSPETAALLSTVHLAISQLPAADVYTDNGGAIPPAPAPGSALLLPAAITGAVTIPTGYGYVEIANGSAVDLTGGDGNTIIVGDGFAYTGMAASVGSGAGVSRITDDAANATLLVGSAGSASVLAGGVNAIVSVGDNGTSAATISGNKASFATGGNSRFALAASGDRQRIVLGNGAVGTATISGAADIVGLGGNSVAQAGTAPAAGLTARIDGTAGRGNTYDIGDADSRLLLALGNADTVNAAAGVSTIFGLAGDVVGTGGAQVEFIGGADGVSTVIGGAANATVFATSAVVFDAGAAQANVFVGGTHGSIINAGAGGGSFFGTGGDLYNFGASAAQTFVGLGGSETLSGAQGSVAPVVFALGSAKLTITAPSPPVTVVSFAADGEIDAMQTAGHNSFFAGYGASGNQTLNGSATGPETFVVGANPSATGTSITINAWHAGDVFYLTGFTAADTMTMDAAIVARNESHGPGDCAFRLSDNTTVEFLTNHPTNFDGAGAAY